LFSVYNPQSRGENFRIDHLLAGDGQLVVGLTDDVPLLLLLHLHLDMGEAHRLHLHQTIGLNIVKKLVHVDMGEAHRLLLHQTIGLNIVKKLVHVGMGEDQWLLLHQTIPVVNSVKYRIPIVRKIGPCRYGRDSPAPTTPENRVKNKEISKVYMGEAHRVQLLQTIGLNIVKKLVHVAMGEDH
jgi:hypothetical protein